MFGFFRKVSISEQKILSKVARELDDQITELTSNYSSIISPEQFDAFMKYQKACYLVYSYGQSWDGSDNMPRVIYNKALKELSALKARHEPESSHLKEEAWSMKHEPGDRVEV